MPCSSTSQLTNASTPVLPLTQPTTPAQWNYFVARLQDIISAVSGAANRQPVNVVPVAYAVYNGSSLPALTVTGATAALDATKAQFGKASLKLTATGATVTVSFTGNPIVIQPFARWIESAYITSSRISITGTLAVVTAVKSYPVDISGTLVPATWGRLYGDCDLTADNSTAATLTLTLTGCTVGDTFNLEGWQLEQSAGTSLPSPFVNTAAPATLDALPDGITRYGAAYPAAVQSGMYGPGANLVLNPSFQLGMMDWALAGGPPSWSAASALGEPCALINPNATPTTSVASSNVVTGLAAGVALSASIEVALNANLTGGDVSADVQFQNSGGTNIGGSARIFTINGTFGGFLRQTLQNIICPANTAQAYIRFYTENATATSAAIRVRRVKLEIGTTCTPFNDAATQHGNKLTQTGSGQQTGDLRNLNMVGVGSLRSAWNNTPSYSSTAGTPAHATISFPASTLTIGAVSVAYNAMSVGVTGTGGTNVQYWLYFDDPGYSGGSQTLVATTNSNDVVASNGRVYVGSVTVAFPASGSGGGGGSSGGGGCVAVDQWVLRGDGTLVRAGEVRAGDVILGCDESHEGYEPLTVESAEHSMEPCLRLVSGDNAVTASVHTPMTLIDGLRIMLPDTLPGTLVCKGDGERHEWQPVHALTHVGDREVVHIRVGGRRYWAGEEPGAYILTHNTIK